MASESRTLDLVDRQILHALQIAPRAPFARIATVLGVSEQTVARRYQRMRGNGIVRVTARPQATHRPNVSSWSLRIGCRPGTATPLAEALARRADTSWISIAGGGAEINCQIEVDSDQAGLLHQVPRASNVLTFGAHQMLHHFPGRGEFDWILPDNDVTAEQRQFLAEPAAPRGGESRTGDARIEPADLPLVEALERDGRASWAALAEATGWSQRQVANRAGELVGGGALYYHLDIADSLVGMGSAATLWFTVAPAHLAAVGARLADHAELAFVAAMTGSANLMAAARAVDAEALYRYITTKVAAIEEIRNVEIVPHVTRLKQSHSLIVGGLVREPPPH
jgi:DNA-binding Lrp family transcriptional regulator